MSTTATCPQTVKLPPGYEEFANEATRPRTVTSRQLKRWMCFWWGGENVEESGFNPDTYLHSLVTSGQLVPVPSPFKHKRMFDTEAVLRWALENGAGR